MGTWSTGPFDNDSAADFAGNIQDCTGPDARHDLLLVTLRAGRQYLRPRGGHPGLHPLPRLTNEYAWGYELEHAIAAAAFVADEHTGVKEFTNTSYARGVGDDMELKPYVQFHPPTPELLSEARMFTAEMLNVMDYDQIDKEWVEPVEKISKALTRKEGEREVVTMWKASVTVAGVPSVPSDDEISRMHAIVPGVFGHDASTGQLTLTWRFDVGHVAQAINVASAGWRLAVAEIADAAPDCTDFRVERVPDDEALGPVVDEMFRKAEREEGTA